MCLSADCKHLKIKVSNIRLHLSWIVNSSVEIRFVLFILLLAGKARTPNVQKENLLCQFLVKPNNYEKDACLK